MSMDSMGTHVDGNAVAGHLQEIFVAEFTALVRTCQSCGDRNAAGAHRGYEGAGFVLRCPTCGDVALRIAAQDGRQVFELRGTWMRSEP
jgi:Family of unknown function (DUF6510)